MAGEVGLSVAGKIAELLIEPIQRELGYVFCFNSNFQELEAKLGELKATRNDVQAREDAEKRMRKTLGENVKLWIEKADGKIVEAESLINDKAELQNGCFSIKWCPNIGLRFSLGRKGKKLSLLLVQLLQGGGQLPHTGHPLPMPSINMRDYYGDARDFDSRSQIMEDIIEKLRDEETMLIGICGMGGIGKTTLAKQVLQKVKDSHKHLFEIQVVSIVSNSPNFNVIQQEVAHMLGSSLKDVDGEIARAHHLRNAFSNKKVVVLLDDVWKEFDLNAFGFPLTKSDVVGCFCKIIYTSRTQGLWSGERNITKQEFSLEILSCIESLNLFKRKVDLPDDDVEKNKIARQIVDECKGLPLALEVVGGALVNKSKYAWNDMLSRLKSQQLHNDKIDKVVQTSYDFLEDPDAQRLFLLCCLFQEDREIPIETLYRYAVGLQLFKGMNNLNYISDRVYTLVDDLTRRNLLIKVKEYAVKMHDVVRDVGISIAKQENNGINYLVCDNVDELENVMSPHIKMITLLFRKKDVEFLDKMEFRDSKLELLRLDSSYIYGSNIKISGNLFEGAGNLKVLDIIGYQGKFNKFSFGYSCKINKFPLFSSPAKLKMLSLQQLSLYMTTNVSSIRHLSCLEVLSFQGSHMTDLPNEISELTNLRLLDLTGCKCFIFNGVLSRLTNLQELYLWNGFNDWRLQNEDINGRGYKQAGLDELNYLHRLWKLELEVANTEQVPRDVRLFSSLTLLKQFKIRIGKGDAKFECGEKQLWLENAINNTTNLSHELGFLIENGITNLCISNDLGMWEKMHVNTLLWLREVILNCCGSIITLFPPLQSQTSKIEEINGLGRYLKRIEIYECNQMRHLCSTLTLRHLTNLQLLILEGCDMTEEIVNNCGEDQQLKKFEFNALETLVLRHLSKLKCFCMGINEIYFHKLKRLKLEGLKQFIFPTKVEIPCLEVLKILYVPNIETLCNLVAPSLKQLYIDNCDNLRYVFSESFLISISHLEYLSIEGCKMLKGLIGVSTGVEEHWKNSIEFSNLKRLCLKSLDQFTSFVIDINNLEDGEEKSQEITLFYHDEISFPYLEELRIIILPKISYIVGWKEGGRHGGERHPDKIFNVLRELMLNKLSNLIHMYEINQPGLGMLLLQNLTQLSVIGCGKLRYLFSENISRVAANNIKVLYIDSCGMMEVVMKKDEELIEDDDDKAGGSNSLGNTHFFPLLDRLTFADLSGLRSFIDVTYTWALPSLTMFNVFRCPKLEALSPRYLDAPRLNQLCYDTTDEVVNVKNTWKGDVNGAFRHLFIKKREEEEKNNSVKQPFNCRKHMHADWQERRETGSQTDKMGHLFIRNFNRF